MGNSSLCVFASIVRSRKIFQARLKSDGPILSFSFDTGLLDWLECRITSASDFTHFYGQFRRLTYTEEFRTTFAELQGFTVKDYPQMSLRLVIKLSNKKGWFDLRVLNQADREWFNMDIRFEEGHNIFGPIYQYFLS